MCHFLLSGPHSLLAELRLPVVLYILSLVPASSCSSVVLSKHTVFDPLCPFSDRQARVRPRQVSESNCFWDGIK